MLIFRTEHAVDVIHHVCSVDSSDDPESVLSELEWTIAMIDSLSDDGRKPTLLCRRLVSLYEHWTFIQSNLPTCTNAAVGVGGGVPGVI